LKNYYSVTEEELKRYEILTQALRGCITLRQASEILGLSYRQCLRLKERFQNEGFEGLFRRSALHANAETCQENCVCLKNLALKSCLIS